LQHNEGEFLAVARSTCVTSENQTLAQFRELLGFEIFSDKPIGPSGLILGKFKG